MTPTPLHHGNLNNDPYKFVFHVATPPGTYGGMERWTLYCATEGGKLEVGDKTFTLEEGMVIHGEGRYFLTGETAEIFVAGVGEPAEVVKAHIASNAHAVTKPWGSERWLTGKENPDYCLKVIQIKAGNQTSLQYHERKVETNVLWSGEAIFVSETREVPFETKHYISVHPGVVHRIRSDTDIILIEASTDDLDDVIRLEDDAGRGNGKIDEEHK